MTAPSSRTALLASLHSEEGSDQPEVMTAEPEGPWGSQHPPTYWDGRCGTCSTFRLAHLSIVGGRA